MDVTNVLRKPQGDDLWARELARAQGLARGALEDILRLGSANIPDVWLSDEEMIEKGLVDR